MKLFLVLLLASVLFSGTYLTRVISGAQPEQYQGWVLSTDSNFTTPLIPCRTLISKQLLVIGIDSATIIVYGYFGGTRHIMTPPLGFVSDDFSNVIDTTTVKYPLDTITSNGIYNYSQYDIVDMQLESFKKDTGVKVFFEGSTSH